MPEVVERLPGNNILNSEGDVLSAADYQDADRETIDIPAKPEVLLNAPDAQDAPEIDVSTSAYDKQIAVLEAARSQHEDMLDRELDKLGWSREQVVAKYGEFPGEKELAKLYAKREIEIAQRGTDALRSVLAAQKQATINRIADLEERAEAQREFDLKNLINRIDQQKNRS